MYQFFDNIDGLHARATNQCSRFGCMLDHFVDGTMGLLCFFLINRSCLQTGADAPDAEILHVYMVTFMVSHVAACYTGKIELGITLRPWLVLSVDDLMALSSFPLLHRFMGWGTMPLIFHCRRVLLFVKWPCNLAMIVPPVARNRIRLKTWHGWVPLLVFALFFIFEPTVTCGLWPGYTIYTIVLAWYLIQGAPADSVSPKQL
jgi:phosphatidylglycerophosphate synthase